MVKQHKLAQKKMQNKKYHATHENRTRPKCLEGIYANHYTSAAAGRHIVFIILYINITIYQKFDSHQTKGMLRQEPSNYFAVSSQTNTPELRLKYASESSSVQSAILVPVRYQEQKIP